MLPPHDTPQPPLAARNRPAHDHAWHRHNTDMKPTPPQATRKPASRVDIWSPPAPRNHPASGARVHLGTAHAAHRARPWPALRYGGVAAVMLVSATGCLQPNIRYIESKRPILARPTLTLDPLTATDLAGCSEDALRRLRDRDQRMKEHIIKLEIAVDEYNAAARTHNAQHLD
ncbi:MAG: hypothetical protein ACE5E6_10680 [Phycisphaerae bacterium]